MNMEKYGIKLIALVLFIVLATTLTLAVKWEYATLIRIDTEEQHEYIVSGHEPNITFISLRDTSLGNNVKILKVRYHTTVEHLFDSDQTIDGWLGDIGIRNYPVLRR